MDMPNKVIILLSENIEKVRTTGNASFEIWVNGLQTWDKGLWILIAM